jgi:hypothetical protein
MASEMEDEPLNLLDDGTLEHVLSFLRSSQVHLPLSSHAFGTLLSSPHDLSIVATCSSPTTVGIPLFAGSGFSTAGQQAASRFGGIRPVLGTCAVAGMGIDSVWACG